LELGAVDIPERHEVIKLLDDDDENVLNNFIQDNVAIKIEKMQDDDTRKVVEDKAETKEPEQLSNNRLAQSENLTERECQLKDMRTMNFTLLWRRKRSFF
jgi:hypothetical protein